MSSTNSTTTTAPARTSTSTTHHSLPSFAQSFSDDNLMNRNSDDPAHTALPPIQTLSPDAPNLRSAGSPVHDRDAHARGNGKKRARREGTDDAHSGSEDKDKSPKTVRIKEEHDELLDSPRSGPGAPSISVRSGGPSYDSSVPPPLQSRHPKKRRMTASGMGRLNTDIHSGSNDSETGTTPISPVVMGLPINPGDHDAVEQVRTMLSVKRKQEALIEQRRNSVPGLLGASSGFASGSATVHIVKDPYPHKPGPTARLARSPMAGPSRRPTLSTPGHTRRLTPPSVVVHHSASEPHVPTLSNPGGSGLSSTLPTQPGFAHSRANQPGGRKKPADLLLRPRDDDIRPSIQSAPAVPRGGQEPGRFPLTLPTLPPGLNVPSAPRGRPPGQVPPTPTRLTLRGGAGLTVRPNPPPPPPAGPAPPGRSPPGIPIATSLIPPTPTALRHPGYTGEKQAFLAPFETFYDALADAKELKTWLFDQVQRSGTLLGHLQQQQDRIDEAVAAGIDRAVGGVRDEVQRLQARVADLEAQLRVARTEPGPPPRTSEYGASGSGTSAGSSRPAPPRMASHASSTSPSLGGPPETYTFPPVAARPPIIRRISSPPRREREAYDSRGDAPSPGLPYDARPRANMSATRFEPEPSRALPPLQPSSSASSSSRPGGRHDVYGAPPPLPPPQHHRPPLPRDYSGSSAGYAPSERYEREAESPPPSHGSQQEPAGFEGHKRRRSHSSAG